MEPDYYGKKRRKWGKKRGLPKYVKKSNKSQSREVTEHFYYRPGATHPPDSTNVFCVIDNRLHKDYEDVRKLKGNEKFQRRKEHQLDVNISCNSRKNWKTIGKIMDEKKKKKGRRSKKTTQKVKKRRDSSSDSDDDADYMDCSDKDEDEDSFLHITRKSNGISDKRTCYDGRSVYNGMKSHIEWFEESDVDYLEYLKHDKKLSKLSKRRRKKLQDKLRTIEYCKNEMKKFEKAKYILDTVEVNDSRKTVSKSFVRGKPIDPDRSWYKRHKMMQTKSGWRVHSCPKKKKQRDIRNYLSSYFDKKNKIKRGGLFY